ncbi:hypothetical protein [Mycobacteroides abscessus]|uniref:hypothetical protein n=1 Tax=Mycobacteroides abscessus TaxID=36809 RepID=UPI00026836FB|nr:hypothetical protein [Mycobacteroides abscessus]EIT89460.1 hypothetical protein MA4S0303_3258 [Mycobacteroides abscessus 4S-0303]EIT91453.1 hypothetical protein MA4S0726RB_2782 [Mycobacteroides abscessus 4S-0726-RB]EIT95002.1 hypothetical protein MA4S0726RA_3192 [Mycobacteroides abscessus 4S-0726-RA]EIV07352.1 hypothetical protein MA4S0206_3276 [Mycobacteroides abscessus 4S-0206]EIV48422.1 hypothetical protein MA4S0116R_3232 [Mycobacteroides abscessus 4S-0116-R]
MSTTVIRAIGELTPPPPEPIAVQIVEVRASRIDLRAGNQTIGVATLFSGGPSWVVAPNIPGVPTLPVFLVTNRSEAIDALTQVGHIYVAAKTGELK